MKTDVPGVDWLLTGEPRPAQLEAIARSYTGKVWRDHKDESMPDKPKRTLKWAGGPIDGFGFFMEMRVGKTPTLLNEFELFVRDYGFERAFVLCPNQYKFTWVLEAERFGASLPAIAFESTNRDYIKKWVAANPKCMMFVNYEALLYQENLSIFEDFIDDKTYMGADESVMIKGHDSFYTKAALDLVTRAPISRPMTGKPTPQGPQDLWAQLRFARKINGVNFWAFRNKFTVLKSGFKGKKKIVDVKNEHILQDMLGQETFFARRADWGTKIDTDYEVIQLPMHPEQKKSYDMMEEDFMVFLESGEVVSVEQAMAKHAKLQQISSGFILDEFKNPHDIIPFERTPKFVDLMDRLYNQLQTKVLIACVHTETVARLRHSLRKFNPATIAGKNHMSKWKIETDKEKDRFNNDRSCRVMVAQEKAVKYGHTLMGTKEDPCIDLFFYENTYSLDDRAQTEERPQGEGQVAALHVVDYYSSPVEKIIVEALQKKETFAARVMGYYDELLGKSQGAI